MQWKIGRVAAAWCVLVGFGAAAMLAQEPESKPAGKPAEKTAVTEKTPENVAEKAPIPFQIQLLETHIRFEANGDSRKDVHTIVKINDLLGAREFARLAFDFNRAYQQVEIPMVRVTHANGGTSEVLPSAITDAPNPAVEKYPAYQDVRVKAVRILGLQEGDTIEYRVITTTTKHPLAPDFWVEHTFDRSGQVLEERYELDLPSSREVKVWSSQDSASFDKKESGEGGEARVLYSWKYPASRASGEASKKADVGKGLAKELPTYLTGGDVAAATYTDWPKFMLAVQKFFPDNAPLSAEIKNKAATLTSQCKTTEERLRHLYDFVAKRIDTVELPLGATGYASRPAEEILKSGYATPEDKCVLLISLARAATIDARPALTGLDLQKSNPFAVLPTVFTNVFVLAADAKRRIWMDPAEPVTPFAVIAVNLRGKPALLPYPERDIRFFENVSISLPFSAFQKVGVTATVGEDGKLSAKVKYTLRGDNELLLRVAFHKTPKEKWKDVAGLLALSDGFRGVITSATASDPMATKQPFTVEYELTQAKFVDWAKKPVRIPALLPQIGLPDSSTKSSGGGIELGTPLDVETTETLQLPAGTTVQAPAGTMVQRDYATYTSKYGTTAGSLTAHRHIHFVQREVAADRAADYGAFVQAVQNDQAQYFTLERGAGEKAAVK